MFMFFPVMMIVSLLGTVATGGRSGSRSAEINRDRRDYLRYLGSVDPQIAEAIEQQRLSLSWSNPEPAVLWSVIGSRRMWERRPDDADFGHVRIGLASQGLATSLVAPDLGPPEKSDPVTSMELQRLVRHRSTVPSLPVAIALTELTAITIDGDHTVCRSLLRALICHLASMHSPQHLRISRCPRSHCRGGLGLAEMAPAPSASVRRRRRWSGTPDVQQPRCRRDGAQRMRWRARGAGDRRGHDCRHACRRTRAGRSDGPRGRDDCLNPWPICASS